MKNITRSLSASGVILLLCVFVCSCNNGHIPDSFQNTESSSMTREDSLRIANEINKKKAEEQKKQQLAYRKKIDEIAASKGEYPCAVKFYNLNKVVYAGHDEDELNMNSVIIEDVKTGEKQEIFLKGSENYGYITSMEDQEDQRHVVVWSHLAGTMDLYIGHTIDVEKGVVTHIKDDLEGVGANHNTNVPNNYGNSNVVLTTMQEDAAKVMLLYSQAHNSNDQYQIEAAKRVCMAYLEAYRAKGQLEEFYALLLIEAGPATFINGILK